LPKKPFASGDDPPHYILRQTLLPEDCIVGESRTQCYADLIVGPFRLANNERPIPPTTQDEKESLGTALSLRYANANSTAVLRDKLDPGFLERGYESFSGFGPTTNFSLSGFQSLDGGGRYP
jgi:hypothetical protein